MLVLVLEVVGRWNVGKDIVRLRGVGHVRSTLPYW